jgi:hypothetical protein
LDYTGARREGRDEETSEHFFFRQVCEELIARVHPVDWQGPRGTTAAPRRHEIISSWRLAGYRFAMHLLPVKQVRIPEELDSFIEGLKQRLREYELEHLGKASGMEVSAELDIDACEKIESKVQKFLSLASHAGTPPPEADSARRAIVKMVTSGDLVLLSLERVRDLVQRHTRLEEAFKVARLEKPSDFLYGSREQREEGERNR